MDSGPPVPGARVPDPFTLRVNGDAWRTDRPSLAALRFDRFGRPDRHPGHRHTRSRAAQAFKCSHGLDLRASRDAWWHAGRGDARARGVAGLCAAAAAPGDLSHPLRAPSPV